MYDEMNNMEEYPMDQELEAMMNREDNLGYIHIFLSRVGTNTSCSVPVQASDTIASVIERYGARIGLNTNSNLVFENKRTHCSTPDRNMTIGGLGLGTGDVLTCADSARVA